MFFSPTSSVAALNLSDPDKMRSGVIEQEQLLQQRTALMEQVQAVEGKLNPHTQRAGEKK